MTDAAVETAARLRLVSAVDVARGRLTATRFPLDGGDATAARKRRADLLAQLDDYLLPRLRSDGAPLLVVVGGSTGAGKSTLVNSLLGVPLTRPGVLRPTTRSPVLVHHPGDAPWFSAERVFPTLPRELGSETNDAESQALPPAAPSREDGAAGPARALRLAPFAGMPPGLAILDAPDIDSLEVANRELAAQLLAAADLWLFVTTAARYADAVPWELLRAAAARHAQVALVISRVDPGSGEVVADLARLAQENGLGDSPLFVLPEAHLNDEGMLPEAAVAAIAGWLTDLGGSASARDEVALGTRDGVVADLADSLAALADAADEQAATAERLAAIVTLAYADAAASVRAATTDGAMLRGEVLGRWQDFVGASDVMRRLERGIGKFRDSVGAFFRGGRASAQPVEHAIAHSLEAVTLDAVETARERVRAAWRADPAGAALVQGSAGTGPTGAGTSELRAAIAEQIRGWQEDVLAVVREQGEDRRGLARALSFGVNGLAVSLMLVVFASTGGLTGAEFGIAGGSAVLAQKVLEAAFGDDAVRRLSTEASRRLQTRLDSVLEADATLALTAVAAAEVRPEDGELLRSAAAELRAAAQAERAARVAAPERAPTAVPALRGAHLRDRPGSWDDDDATGAAARDLPEETDIALSAARPWWQRMFGSGR